MELRERLHHYGAVTLSTAELLTLVLNRSPKQDPLQMVQQMLEDYDLKRLRNASAQEFEHRAGLSPANAVRLVAICELTRRFAQCEQESRPQIGSCQDAFEQLRPHLAHLDHEEFRVLVLDSQKGVVANLLLYTGTVNSMPLRVAEVFHPAIVRKCPSIIIGHNHPSGRAVPSSEDQEVTRTLVTAGQLLNIELVDHLIIGNPGWLSLREQMKW